MKKVIKKGMVFCMMMSLAAFFFSYAAIAGSTSDDAAQRNNAGDAGPPAMQDAWRPPHPPPAGPVMRALDTDRDGLLSATEIAGASAALLTLDKDGDGVLSSDELRPEPPGGFRGRQRGNRPSWAGQENNSSDAP